MPEPVNFYIIEGSLSPFKPTLLTTTGCSTTETETTLNVSFNVLGQLQLQEGISVGNTNIWKYFETDGKLKPIKQTCAGGSTEVVSNDFLKGQKNNAKMCKLSDTNSDYWVTGLISNPDISGNDSSIEDACKTLSRRAGNKTYTSNTCTINSTAGTCT